MQAIEVIFVPPTNSKPIRYKVTCHAGTKFFSQEKIDETLSKRGIPLSDDNRARLAAEMFCNVIGWTEDNSKGYQKLAQGGLKNGNHVFVFVDEREHYNNTDYHRGA